MQSLPLGSDRVGHVFEMIIVLMPFFVTVVIASRLRILNKSPQILVAMGISYGASIAAIYAYLANVEPTLEMPEDWKDPYRAYVVVTVLHGVMAFLLSGLATAAREEAAAKANEKAKAEADTVSGSDNHT